tara:strand:- start:604 stop:1707 length:1104 start_codon:yes stop_codon:yes gene_type:complete
MSTKRDNFTSKDKKYMKLALNLASARKGLTGENPSVGCVIVKNDKIISIGQTGFGGRPHAEHNAILNCFEDLENSKMYTTLEPCNHYGKTPPCTKNIIKNKISEVYYPIEDIDLKVKGKSYLILKNNKIKVKKGLLRKEALNLYKSYYINRKKQLPYVIGKIALSKNKIIYSDKLKRITNEQSDKLTHYLRLKSDGILITSKTLNIDNPRLNCRLEGYSHYSPKRIILDRNLKIDLRSYIVKSLKKGNTIIFYNSNNKIKKNFLVKKGAILIKQPIGKHKNFDLKKILKKLYKKGIKNLLVEGGDELTKNFLQKAMFNEFYMFTSPKNLLKKNEYVNFTSFDILKKKYNSYKIDFKLAPDKLTIYKN